MVVSRNFQFTQDNYGLQRDIIFDKQRYVGGAFWSSTWKMANKFAAPLIQKALPALRKTAFGKIEDFVSKGIGKVSDVLETGRQKIRDELPRGILQDIFDEGVKVSKDILGAKTREALTIGEDSLNKKYDYVEEQAKQMVSGSGLKEDVRDFFKKSVSAVKGKTRETLGIGEKFLEKQVKDILSSKAQKRLEVGKTFLKKKTNLIEDFAKDLVSGSGMIIKNKKAEKLIRQFLKNRNI